MAAHYHPSGVFVPCDEVVGVNWDNYDVALYCDVSVVACDIVVGLKAHWGAAKGIKSPCPFSGGVNDFVNSVFHFVLPPFLWGFVALK